MSHPSKFFQRKRNTNPGTVFVIMPFAKEFQPIYEIIIKPFIEETMKMECLRGDEIYGDKKVMDDIWDSIQRAEIIIADLTGKNPNVMYELGLAHCLWKNCILITQKGEDVPFDLRGYRLIIYESSIGGAERLKEELARTIEAIRKEPLIESTIVEFKQPFHPREPRYKEVEADVEAVAKDYLLLKLTTDGRTARLDAHNFNWFYTPRDLTRKFKLGDRIPGVIISETKVPCVFSMKHKRPNPWPQFQKRYPPGYVFVGNIVHVSNYAVFVEINQHVDGMIPKANFPQSEALHRGDQVKVRIDSINPDKKEVRLSLVRKITRPEPEQLAKYKEGEKYTGKVVSIQDYGLIVELEKGVTGLCHISQFSVDAQKKLEDEYPIGKEAKWLILSIDMVKRRISFAPSKSKKKKAVASKK